MNKMASFLPPLAVLISIISLCVGSSYGKSLFPQLGAEGVTAYRVGLAAIMLIAFWRPWRTRLSKEELRAIAIYGLILGSMNFCFYKAITTIPLGIAIAIEFIGPLAVAIYSSRRLLDFVWIGFAVLGLGMLLPLHADAKPLDVTGVAFVLMAALLWALYIVYGKRALTAHEGQVTSLGLAVASVLVVPIGIFHAGAKLLEPQFLALGALVGLLSSAIPYSLEMFALKRLPKQTFGILLSMEPAVGAISAWIILGEVLTASQWIAILSVIVASVGSTMTIKQQQAELANADPIVPS
jgi:inner membrane transporter RhtA